MGRKKIMLTINSKVKEILSLNRIDSHDGLSYLLCIYYGLEPTYLPETLKNKVLASKIITKDYSTGEIIWNEALFEESVKGYEWVKEWMDLFKQVNPARRGVKSYVITRMKRFFVNNPEIRVEQVMDATKKYLSTVDNPAYCKNSHKFIYEADGSSMLESYIDQIKDGQDNNNRLNRKVI